MFIFPKRPGDAAHCAVWDLYVDFREQIEAALAQGDFDTGWQSSKKSGTFRVKVEDGRLIAFASIEGRAEDLYHKTAFIAHGEPSIDLVIDALEQAFYGACRAKTVWEAENPESDDEDDYY